MISSNLQGKTMNEEFKYGDNNEVDSKFNFLCSESENNSEISLLQNIENVPYSFQSLSSLPRENSVFSNEPQEELMWNEKDFYKNLVNEEEYTKSIDLLSLEVK